MNSKNAECRYRHRPQVSSQVAAKLTISTHLMRFSVYKGKI